MASFATQAIRRWVQFSAARGRLILISAAVLSLLGAVGTVRLYGDLRPDFAELLPQNAPSVIDMQAVHGRVGGAASDTIILHGATTEVMKRFADDLAAQLQEHVPKLLRRVEYRVDSIESFFHARRWLFPAEHDLIELRDRVEARLNWEKSHANPLFVSFDDEDTPPNFDDLRARLESQGSGIKRFGEGYYVGEVPGAAPGKRQEILVLLARMSGTPENFDLVQDVDRAVRAAVAKLNPSSYSPTLEVGYAGDVASAILEHDALAEDLTIATILVIVIVAVSLALYYRTWKAIMVVGTPLFVGTLVTFGIAELAVGHLNSNTAFLGSIVIGNGINVGLVFFARYIEERRHAAEPLLAMETAIAGTWVATLTASLAAGISYGSLLVTQSRGFSQFGLVGGVGMATCWLASYMVMPAICLTWEKRRPLLPAATRAKRSLFTNALARSVERFPQSIVILSTVALLAAVWAVTGFVKDPIENNFSHLRNAKAMQIDQPGWWDERVDALFGDHLTPTVLLCRDSAEAQDVAEIVTKARDRNPADTAIGTVFSIGTVVPNNQVKKIRIIEQIRGMLDPKATQWMPASARRQLDALMPPTDLKPFGPSELPVLLKERLTETDGHLGTMVLIYPRASLNVWDGRDVVRFARELRTIELPRKDIPASGSILVFADMLTAMAYDGPRATILSFVGVAILVVLMFASGRRRGALSDAGMVLATLLLGVIWFVGLAAATNLRVNMLNFIAFPITFGIGADYATNLIQRRRVDPGLSIADCLRTTGGAVALCSWTTIIGYGSLLVARNQALVSFGLLAVLGEVACLGAALWPLAALLHLHAQRNPRAPT